MCWGFVDTYNLTIEGERTCLLFSSCHKPYGTLFLVVSHIFLISSHSQEKKSVFTHVSEDRYTETDRQIERQITPLAWLSYLFPLLFICDKIFFYLISLMILQYNAQGHNTSSRMLFSFFSSHLMRTEILACFYLRVFQPKNYIKC